MYLEVLCAEAHGFFPLEQSAEMHPWVVKMLTMLRDAAISIHLLRGGLTGPSQLGALHGFIRMLREHDMAAMPALLEHIEMFDDEETRHGDLRKVSPQEALQIVQRANAVEAKAGFASGATSRIYNSNRAISQETPKQQVRYYFLTEGLYQKMGEKRCFSHHTYVLSAPQQRTLAIIITLLL